MLLSNHPIIKHRVRLLNLTGELPNIAKFQKGSIKRYFYGYP